MKKRNITTLMMCIFLLSASIQLSFGQGARYTGEYTKTTQIRYNNRSNFVIEGFEISGSSDKYLIVLSNCENVIIRNNKLHSSPTKVGVYLDNSKNITIVDNTFENVQSGLKAHRSQGVKFEYNDVKNVTGPLRGGDRIGNMAQFDKVSGAGNSISYNVADNLPGQSAPEDVINLFQSHGTASSPIIVKGNWIRGGGPSDSGGGIILGDMGGSHQIAEDNIVVDGGQYGISIAGGNHLVIRNNKVYGKQNSFTNVGIYAANWSPDLGQTDNITVENNSVNYRNKNGVLNNYWFANNVGNIKGQNTNRSDASISASILPSQIIGRARNGVTNPTPNPEPNPIPNPEPNPTPDPNPNPGVDNGKGDDHSNGNDQANEHNDPSIIIYKDRFNRLCVITTGRIAGNSQVIVGMEGQNERYTQSLTGFHTAINHTVPSGWTLDVFVRNGDKTKLERISF